MTAFFKPAASGDPRSHFSLSALPAGVVAGEVRRCPGCGEAQPFSEFAVDRSKSSGRKSHCRRCDRERAARYYRQNREAMLARDAERRSCARPPEPRHCSECSEPLGPPRRVVCSERCRDARYRRLHPEAYAAKEARKAERRREKRREASEAGW